MHNQKIRESNLYDAISDVADYEMQKIAWLGYHPLYVIDFDETRAMLYDNSGFEDFINDFEQIYGSNDLIKRLQKLNNLLRDYRPDLTDEEILQDPDWINITIVAKEVIDAWNLEKPDH